jgi:hypothetical protein
LIRPSLLNNKAKPNRKKIETKSRKKIMEIGLKETRANLKATNVKPQNIIVRMRLK